MAVYSPTSWSDGSGQPINASNLNKIEAGIVAALRADGGVSATAQLKLALGTAAIPSIASSTGTNTGLYFPTTTSTALTTSGIERVRIDASGNMGISITSPLAKLHTASTGVLLSLDSYGNAVGAGVSFRSAKGTQTTPVLTAVNDVIMSLNAYGYGTAFIYSGGISMSAAEAFSATAAGSQLSFTTTPVTTITPLERMRITSQGNVGIGTNSPTGDGTALHIHGSVDYATLHLTNPTTGSGLSDGSDLVVSGLDFIMRNRDAGKLSFHTSNAEKMMLTSGGSLGIGLTPTYQLQLSLDSAAKPTSQTWTIASDSRIKDVKGAYSKGLKEICALRPISYELNGKGGFRTDGKEHVSIIAQEAMEVFPECVGTFAAKLNPEDSEETVLYNWNGDAVSFALINAIRELNQKIVDLEEKLAAK